MARWMQAGTTCNVGIVAEATSRSNDTALRLSRPSSASQYVWTVVTYLKENTNN